MIVNPNQLKPHPKNAEIYFDLNDGLDKSIKQHGILRPIIVNRDFVILDGHRRWVRAKKFGVKEVPIEIREFQNEIIALIELNRYRVKQPREVYNESRVLSEELAKQSKVGRPSKETLSNLTKLSPKDVTHVRDEVAKKLNVSNGQLYKIKKIYENEEKIPKTVKELDSKKISVHQAFKTLQQVEHKTQPTKIEPPKSAEGLPNEFFITNVWMLLEKRPDGYGSKDFRGNCDPTIVDQTLRRYLGSSEIQKGVTILDPMAGSGTFIDVAKNLGITNILAFDIKPLRDDIQFGDAEKLPLDNDSIDFVFCHYPYWNMWKYSDHPEDLSNVDYETFLRKVENIFKEFYRILKKNSYLCILIGNKRELGIIDLEAEFSKKGQRYFKLWDKIITVVGDPAGHAHTAHDGWGVVQHRALKNKWTIQNYDTLLVFRKEK